MYFVMTKIVTYIFVYVFERINIEKKTVKKKIIDVSWWI